MVHVPKQTLHCHTRFSDGSAEPAEMVAAAAAAGFDRIGISDHLVLHPDIADVDWSMRPDQVGEYVDAVRAAGDDADVEVLAGLEVDYFPEPAWRDRLGSALAGHDVDYLIGSIHYLDRFNLDGRAEDWQHMSAEEIDIAHCIYWERVAGMAAAGGWAFLGHLDLPKKFGYMPSAWPRELIDEALEAITTAAVPIELNTGGWSRPCADGYPGADLLRRCRGAGIEVLVNDDAHAPEHLGQHFDRAAEALESAGYAGVTEAV